MELWRCWKLGATIPKKKVCLEASSGPPPDESLMAVFTRRKRPFAKLAMSMATIDERVAQGDEDEDESPLSISGLFGSAEYEWMVAVAIVEVYEGDSEVQSATYQDYLTRILEHMSTNQLALLFRVTSQRAPF